MWKESKREEGIQRSSQGESTTVDKERSDKVKLGSMKRDLKINYSWQVAKES